MKRVLVVLAALAMLWMPEYLWAMDQPVDLNSPTSAVQVLVHD